MKIYDITVSANKNQFVVIQKEFEVLEYKKDTVLSYEMPFVRVTLNKPNLDNFNLGLLDSEIPTINIRTLESELVPKYIEIMKNMLISSIEEKIQLNTIMLQMLKESNK